MQIPWEWCYSESSKQGYGIWRECKIVCVVIVLKRILDMPVMEMFLDLNLSMIM